MKQTDRLVALGGQVVDDPTQPWGPWLVANADRVQAETGIQPFPMTLRVALDMPWRPPEARRRIDLPVSKTAIAWVPCEVDRIHGCIVWADSGDNPTQTTIDVIAAVDLRHVLARQGNDRIQVVVNRSDAKNIVTARRLAVLVALGIAVTILGTVFGVLVTLTSLKFAATVLVVGAVAVTGILWRARFFRQASIYPDSVPLRWPNWPT